MTFFPALFIASLTLPLGFLFLLAGEYLFAIAFGLTTVILGLVALFDLTRQMRRDDL